MTIKSEFSRDTIIQRNSDNEIFKTDLGEEMVVMDIESGNYLSINKVGKVIWEIVEQPTAVKVLVEALMQRFEVTEEKCFDECDRYLAEMLQHKLVRMY